MLIVLVGGGGIVLGTLVGPWAVQVLFAGVARPAVSTLALLGVGTVLMMLALSLQPALVALGRQSTVTAGWGLGALVFLAVLAGPAMPGGPLLNALAAQIAGPAVAAAHLAIGVGKATRRYTPAATRSPLPQPDR